VFKAVVKPDCGGLCVLECKRCEAYVSPDNPSQAAQRHKCTAAALAAAGVRGSPQKGGHPDLPAALKKHAVRTVENHTPAAFVLDPTNFIIEEGKRTACIYVQALH